jgi:hypothetical protein
MGAETYHHQDKKSYGGLGGWIPEQLLMAHILADALQTVAGAPANSGTPTNWRKLRAETEAWLNSNSGYNAQAPLSFENVAMAVGLEPEAVRDVVKRANRKQLVELAARLRNTRHVVPDLETTVSD